MKTASEIYAKVHKQTEGHAKDSLDVIYTAMEEYAQAYHEDKTRALTEHQFHIVWTAAVGMTGYDKVLFRELLDKLVKEEKVIPTPP